VGGEQQGEGSLWRGASRDHGNPDEQREHWTERRDDWRTGDGEESSQAHNNRLFQTAGLTSCGPPQRDYTREPPTPRPVWSNKAANEMSAHTGKRSAPRRKGSKSKGRDNYD